MRTLDGRPWLSLFLSHCFDYGGSRAGQLGVFEWAGTLVGQPWVKGVFDCAQAKRDAHWYLQTRHADGNVYYYDLQTENARHDVQFCTLQAFKRVTDAMQLVGKLCTCFA